ncbi:hypothetical protein CPB86DRAFT_812949 [Serendipita vermifera]|nr:hypothetical protein CPB86DRAFT_812949 [Serendipita vermifera]
MTFPSQPQSADPFADSFYQSPFDSPADGDIPTFNNATSSLNIVQTNVLPGLTGQPIVDPSGQHLGGGAHDVVFENSLDETNRFLNLLEQTCSGSKIPFFTSSDAQLLHDILQNKVRPEEKKKVFEFLSDFSGNRVEHIQTAIIELSQLLASRIGFFGIWTPSSGQALSQMLTQYVVVCRLPSGGVRRAYTTVNCNRPRCLACRSNVRVWTERWRDATVCLSAYCQDGSDVWKCPLCPQFLSTKDIFKRHYRQCMRSHTSGQDSAPTQPMLAPYPHPGLSAQPDPTFPMPMYDHVIPPNPFIPHHPNGHDLNAFPAPPPPAAVQHNPASNEYDSSAGLYTPWGA